MINFGFKDKYNFGFFVNTVLFCVSKNELFGRDSLFQNIYLTRGNYWPRGFAEPTYEKKHMETPGNPSFVNHSFVFSN